jgi:hypothetical protein
VAFGIELEDRVLCGWRVRSTFPLPELPPWSGAEAAPVDVHMLEAEVPEQLDGALSMGPRLSIAGDGAALVNVPGLVRILIRQGCEVAVQVLEPGAGDDWKLFLLGSALAMLTHQRGLFPLHAAAVSVNGRTLSIAGRGGAGKSTLALHMAGRGHALLSDDATVLKQTLGGFEVLPALPRIKLWRTALDAAGVDPSALARVRQGIEKFYLRPEAPFDPAPSPLRGILILVDAEELSLERLEPKLALAAMRPHVYRRQIGAALQGRQRLFTRMAELVSSTPVYCLRRPKRFEALPEMAGLIETTASHQADDRW